MVTDARYADDAQYDEPSNEPLYEYWQYGLYFTIGSISRSVEINNADLSLKQFQSSVNDGYKLDYNTGTGQFIFNDRDGGVIKVPGYIAYGKVELGSSINFVSPNGLKLEFTGAYRDNIRISARWVTTNGLVVVKEAATLGSTFTQQKICAYNLAYTDLASTTNCAQSSMVATLKYQRMGEYDNLVEVVRPDASVFRFEYQRVQAVNGYTALNGNGDRFKQPKIRYNLTCVRTPTGSCQVTNVYDACDGFSGQGYPIYGIEDRGWTGSRDRVTRQNLADGTSVFYSYPGQSTPCRDVASIVVTNSSGAVDIDLKPQSGAPLSNVGYEARSFPMIESVTDQLGRKTEYKWTGANAAAFYLRRDDLLSEVIDPEGNSTKRSYDGRGNIQEIRIFPKPGSGATQIAYSATYASTCANFKNCNKPLATTDARGMTSTFTYSPDHGGVLTSVGPAVDGVSPATKYYYEQRYAWLKNGVGFAAVSDPVWLPTEERSCKTSALNLSTGQCAAGAGDMVQKLYEYGPNSGPNNLWLRGVAIVSSGETLRTCYSYDRFGRRISETKPPANLSVCP